MRLRAPPRHAPRRLRSTADLRELQRLMIHAIVRPMTDDDTTPRTWMDGRPTAEVAEEFIKANDRLNAVERLQIYQRMYWYRLIGSATDDSPGLRALLGEERFDRMIRAYLAKHPSQSFTLRDLCSKLAAFISEERQWTAPRTALALAVARFEWAQTVAFDGRARPLLTPRDIQRTPPGKLKVGLQPYLSLLELTHPVDTYVTAVKKRDALRGEASHAVDGVARIRGRRRVPLPARQRIYLAVHRYDSRLFYKRLAKAEWNILQALGKGRTVPAALKSAGREVRPAEAQRWFATWMHLGWLCRPSKNL